VAAAASTTYIRACDQLDTNRRQVRRSTTQPSPNPSPQPPLRAMMRDRGGTVVACIVSSAAQSQGRGTHAQGERSVAQVEVCGDRRGAGCLQCEEGQRVQRAESGSEHPRSGAREVLRGSRLAMVNEEAPAASSARRDRECAQLLE
jgi:hypothetical protein